MKTIYPILYVLGLALIATIYIVYAPDWLIFIMSLIISLVALGGLFMMSVVAYYSMVDTIRRIRIRIKRRKRKTNDNILRKVL